MKRVCAWCNKDMGTLLVGGQSQNIITHGICEECANKIFTRIGLKSESFLDDLAAPVLVVDEIGRTISANRLARVLLKKDLQDTELYNIGDMFECANAALPEGCGKTIHCSTCTIRSSVMDTFESGESKLEVKAYLHRGKSDNSEKIDLSISTEKINGVVLLRIDEIGN